MSIGSWFGRLGCLTLRLRHDLQFIDSRGSLLMRRAGSLSMPTCGRDIGMGWTAGGGATPVVSKGTVMPKVMNGIRQDGEHAKRRAGGYKADLGPGDAARSSTSCPCACSSIGRWSGEISDYVW